MKITLKSIFLFVVLLITVISCSKKDEKSSNNQATVESDPSKGKPSSGGKTLEVILVIPDEVYKGDVKDTIGTYFMKACDGLHQAEPLFDVVQMNPSGFYNSDMLLKHRNIIIVDLDVKNENKIFKKYNYKSYPQAYFEFSVNNKDSLFSLIHRYAPTIINKFYDNEHKRVYAAFKKLENVDVTKKFKNILKLSMMFSREFYLATMKEDFAWIRREVSGRNESSLNIMVHTLPYTGEGMFNEDKIIELRDKISKEYIPGPTRGSYMGTETRFPYVRKTVRLTDDITAIETRGLWRLFNDFMGGPFINYCFLDTKNNRFVMIDCFAYSPKTSKRDNLMTLESIVYSIKIE